MDRKPLPNILRVRAERILKKPVVRAYRLNEDDANLLELLMKDGSSKFVDLTQGKEISVTAKTEQVNTATVEPDTAPIVERKERKKKISTKASNTVTKKARKKSTK